jgi:hypothetical protein
MTGAEEVAWDNFNEFYRMFGKTYTWLSTSVFVQRETDHRFIILVKDIKRGRIKITPEFMRSITNPALKQKVIEAICLARI